MHISVTAFKIKTGPPAYLKNKEHHYHSILILQNEGFQQSAFLLIAGTINGPRVCDSHFSNLQWANINQQWHVGHYQKIPLWSSSTTINPAQPCSPLTHVPKSHTHVFWTFPRDGDSTTSPGRHCLHKITPKASANSLQAREKPPQKSCPPLDTNIHRLQPMWETTGYTGRWPWLHINFPRALSLHAQITSQFCKSHHQNHSPTVVMYQMKLVHAQTSNC